MAIEKFIRGVIDGHRHHSRASEKRRLDASSEMLREYKIPEDPYLSKLYGGNYDTRNPKQKNG